MSRLSRIYADFKNPVTLAIGLAVTINYGSLFYSLAVFAPVMSEEFGVGLDTFFAVFAVGLLIGGLFAPFVGSIIDRRGARPVMCVGSVMAALALVSLSYVPSLWYFAAAIIFLEFAAAMVLYEAAFAGLSQRYGQGARRSIAAVTLIAGFASTIFWPLTQFLTEAYGWRNACLVFAAVQIFVCLPLLWHALRPGTREHEALDIDEEARPAEIILEGPARQRAIYFYSFSVCVSGIVFAAMPVHMLLVLQGEGVSAQNAAFIAMAVGPAQVVARIIEMAGEGRHSALVTGKVCFGFLPLALLVLLLPGSSVAYAIAFAIIYGVAQGLSNIVRGTVPLEIFGSKGYGALVGKITAIRFALNAGAPFMFAYLSTQWSLSHALAVFMGVAIISAISFWQLHPPQRPAPVLT